MARDKMAKNNKKSDKSILKKVNGYVDIGWRHIKTTKNYSLFIAGLFVLGAIGGVIFYGRLQGILEPLLKEIASQFSGLNAVDTISFIFLNNLKSAFYSMILGALLGIYPIVNALINGSVIGYVLDRVWRISGARDFWKILPHGVFELPAVVVSLGMGVHLGMFIFSKNRMKEFKSRLVKSILAFVFIVVPLLVLAAIIEGTLIMALR